MNDLPPLLSLLQREHLAEDQQQIFDAIGADAYRKLVDEFGGTRIYVPKRASLRPLVHSYLVRYYTPADKNRIAGIVGVSIDGLRRIVYRAMRLKHEEPSNRCYTNV